MEHNKLIFIKLLIILLPLSMAHPVFSETMKGPGVSITGTILDISPQFESLTLFEKTVKLTSSTVVLYEDGIKRRVQDLKPGLLVVVEAVNTSKGLFAKRIILQKLRRE